MPSIFVDEFSQSALMYMKSLRKSTLSRDKKVCQFFGMHYLCITFLASHARYFPNQTCITNTKHALQTFDNNKTFEADSTFETLHEMKGYKKTKTELVHSVGRYVSIRYCMPRLSTPIRISAPSPPE